MNEKQIKQLCRMAKQFEKLYNDDDAGLCGIHQDFKGVYVHVTEQVFAELMVTYSNYDIKIRSNTEEYPYEASIYINKIRFMTIGTEQEFRSVGIPLPILDEDEDDG